MQVSSKIAERELSEALISMDTLRNEAENAINVLREKEATITQLTQTVNDLKDRERTLQAEGVSLSATVATFQGQIAEYNAVIESLQGELHSASERLKLLESVIAENDATIIELRDVQVSADERVSGLTTQVRAMNGNNPNSNFTWTRLATSWKTETGK